MNSRESRGIPNSQCGMKSMALITLPHRIFNLYGTIINEKEERGKKPALMQDPILIRNPNINTIKFALGDQYLHDRWRTNAIDGEEKV